jgi:hypothetical protein
MVSAAADAFAHDGGVRVTPILGSIAVNAAVLALLGVLGHHDRAVPPTPPPMEITVVDVAPPVTPVPMTPSPSGGGGMAAKRAVATRSARAHASSAWSEVVVREEAGTSDHGGDGGQGAGGTGGGLGGGHGRGIGLGDGGGIGGMTDLPAPPAPPPPSLARSARLLHPSRQTDTDDAELFVARVTVDTDGDVVGAHMVRSHPGSRGDTASSMIWQFRYDPARDDAGNPVRSTFEQKFAVR